MKETKKPKTNIDVTFSQRETSTFLTGLIIAGFCIGLALTTSTAIMVLLSVLLILSYLHLMKSE